jgi:hypothetical protein
LGQDEEGRRMKAARTGQRAEEGRAYKEGEKREGKIAAIGSPLSSLIV